MNEELFNNLENNYLFCPENNCLNIPEILYEYSPLSSNVQYFCNMHTNTNEINQMNLSEFIEKSSNIKCYECHIDISKKDIYYCIKCKHVYDYDCFEEHVEKYNHSIIPINKNNLANNCLEHNNNYIFHCKECNKSLCSLCNLNYHNIERHNLIQIINAQNSQNDKEKKYNIFQKQKKLLEKIKKFNEKIFESLENDIIIKQRIIVNNNNYKYNFKSIFNFNNIDIENNNIFEELLDDIINKEEQNQNLDKEGFLSRILAPLYYSLMINKNKKDNEEYFYLMEKLIINLKEKLIPNNKKENNFNFRENSKSKKAKLKKSNNNIKNYPDEKNENNIFNNNKKDNKYINIENNRNNNFNISLDCSKRYYNISKGNIINNKTTENFCKYNLNNFSNNDDNYEKKIDCSGRYILGEYNYLKNNLLTNKNNINDFSITNNLNPNCNMTDNNKFYDNNNIQGNYNNEINKPPNITPINDNCYNFSNDISSSSNNNFNLNNSFTERGKNNLNPLINSKNNLINSCTNFSINLNYSSNNNFKDNNLSNKYNINESVSTHEKKKKLETSKNKSIKPIYNMIILSSGNFALSVKEAIEIYDFRKLNLSDKNNMIYNNEKIIENNCLLQRINLTKGKKINYVFEFPDNTLLCATFSKIFRIKLINDDLSYKILGILKLGNTELPTKLISLGDSLLLILSELKSNCLIKVFKKKSSNNSEINEDQIMGSSSFNQSFEYNEKDLSDKDYSSNEQNDGAPPIGNILYDKKSLEVDKSFQLIKHNINKERKLFLSIFEIKKPSGDYLYEFIATSNQVYNYGDDRIIFFGVKKFDNGQLNIYKIKIINNVSCSIQVNSVCQIKDQYICVGLQNHDLKGQISGFALLDIFTRDICRIIRDQEISSLYFIEGYDLLLASMEVRDTKKNYFMTKLFQVNKNPDDKGNKTIIDLKKIYEYKHNHTDTISSVIELKTFNFNLNLEQKALDENIIYVTSSHDSTLEVIKTKYIKE